MTLTENQLNEISNKDQTVKKLINKIKWFKPSNITFEVLRLQLEKVHQVTTHETELRLLLKVR